MSFDQLASIPVASFVRGIGLRRRGPGRAERVGRGAHADAQSDRGAVLSRSPAARHRQRPAPHQRRRHDPAVGEITHLGGRVLDARRRAASQRAWSKSGKSTATASTSTRAAPASDRDANFQGYGRFLTGPSGEYYFRTVKPVLYPAGTPHIHFAINRNGKRLLTTQIYVKGHPGNDKDGVYNSHPRRRAARMPSPSRSPAPRAARQGTAGKVRHRPRPHPGGRLIAFISRVFPRDARENRRRIRKVAESP